MERKSGAELAIGVLLLLSLAAAALSIYAVNRKSEHWGPRVIERASSGEVWLIVDQDLYIADPEGKLRYHIPLDHLPGPVNAIAPLPIRDGQHRMLLGVIGQQEWLVMDEAGREVNRVIPSGIDMPFNETYHLATSPDGRIAVGSGGDHRVLLFSEEGKFLAQSAPDLFRYANGLWFEDERWWVVDTNHHQIRQLAGDTLNPVATVPAIGDGVAVWPTLARRSPVGQNTITVSVMRHGMQVGMVQELDAEGELLHAYPLRAKLPEPTDFLWLGHRLLIADRVDFSLQQFDHSGQHLGSWGDEEITKILKDAYADRQLWSDVLQFAQIAAVLLGAVALLGYAIRKRRDATVPASESDDGKGIIGANLPLLSAKQQLLGVIKLNWPIFTLSLLYFAMLLGFGVPLAIIVVALIHGLGTIFFVILGVFSGIALVVALIGPTYPFARFAQKRMQNPRYEDVLIMPWTKWLRQSSAVRSCLNPGEQVREVLPVLASRFFPLFNRNVWVLTKQRLLIFEVGSGGREKLLADLPRSRVSASYAPPPGFGMPAEASGTITLKDEAGAVWRAYPASPVTAQRLLGLLGLKCSHANVAPHIASGLPGKVRGVKLLIQRPLAAFLISLLLPGVAQMLQSRFALGLMFFTFALSIWAFMVTPVLLSWVGHFYDISTLTATNSMIYAAIPALLASWEASNYARRMCSR
ncbi:MAG: hypothetical protein Q8O37_13270 [Sulfuricellaceae bacterium]|nr:hypothetical protein [Sulfuricellaceae bacterium]